MAPLPIIADTYRVAFNWACSGQIATNVMHFRKSSSTASAVATNIDANVTANMWNSVVSTASVTNLHVTPLDGTSVTYVLATTGAKWAGAAAGDQVPNAPVIVSIRTSARGRSYRGRIYLPFTNEGDIGAGSLGSANAALMQTAWNSFLTAMSTATCIPVVASYKLATATNVASYLVETQLGTQRRRQSRLR